MFVCPNCYRALVEIPCPSCPTISPTNIISSCPGHMGLAEPKTVVLSQHYPGKVLVATDTPSRHLQDYQNVVGESGTSPPLPRLKKQFSSPLFHRYENLCGPRGGGGGLPAESGIIGKSIETSLLGIYGPPPVDLLPSLPPPPPLPPCSFSLSAASPQSPLPPLLSIPPSSPSERLPSPVGGDVVTGGDSVAPKPSHRADMINSPLVPGQCLLQHQQQQLQLQQREISEQISLLQIQVLQKKLERLEEEEKQLQLHRELLESHQLNTGGADGVGDCSRHKSLISSDRLRHLQRSSTNSSLLHINSSSLQATPALLITANSPSSCALTDPQTLEIAARFNLFGQHTSVPELSPAELTRRLELTRTELTESNWYHGQISWQESNHLLEGAEEGSFLVRDSQHPGCYYSLSIQRSPKLGPTSIRIQFLNGGFSLDSQNEDVRRRMPAFNTVSQLIEFYVSCARKEDEDAAAAAKSAEFKWRDGDYTTAEGQGVTGQKHVITNPVCRLFDAGMVPFKLRKPLYKQPPSLRHLCRLSVNKALKTTTTISSGSTFPCAKAGAAGREQLNLPLQLVQYLESYSLSV